MSSTVNVAISAVMASAARRSAFQCRQAPSRPSEANTTASPRCRPPIQSRPHCQLKYWTHIPIWATSEACRWLTGGLPYCWRVSTSHSAFQVVGSLVDRRIVRGANREEQVHREAHHGDGEHG